MISHIYDDMLCSYEHRLSVETVVFNKCCTAYSSEGPSFLLKYWGARGLRWLLWF